VAGVAGAALITALAGLIATRPILSVSPRAALS